MHDGCRTQQNYIFPDFHDSYSIPLRNISPFTQNIWPNKIKQLHIASTFKGKMAGVSSTALQNKEFLPAKSRFLKPKHVFTNTMTSHSLGHLQRYTVYLQCSFRLFYTSLFKVKYQTSSKTPYLNHFQHLNLDGLDCHKGLREETSIACLMLGTRLRSLLVPFMSLLPLVCLTCTLYTIILQYISFLLNHLKALGPQDKMLLGRYCPWIWLLGDSGSLFSLTLAFKSVSVT